MGIDSEKNATWDDIAAFIDSLTPEQRKQHAYALVSDDGHGKRLNVDTIEWDVYAHKDNDDDAGPIEELREMHGEDFVETDYELVTPKGTPFIYID